MKKESRARGRRVMEKRGRRRCPTEREQRGWEMSER